MNPETTNQIFTALEEALHCAERKLGRDSTNTLPLALQLDQEPEAVLVILANKLRDRVASL